MFQNVEVEEEQLVDERPVDELLSFINGDGGLLEKFYILFLVKTCFILLKIKKCTL